MDENSPIEIETVDCPHCGKCMDVSDLRPFSLAVCPVCQGMARVRVEMGPYMIVGKLGKGGMSVVFRAEDTLLSRNVALKILNENYSSDEVRINRFEQEARIMARVQHPHIVKIYGVGRSQGYFYIAMELVEGKDLETVLCEEGKLDEPDVLRIAIQVANALKEAWKSGMVHRDVKPANILVDERRNAKIVDFGLSLLQNEKDNDREIWVTPFYASPEALAREEEDFRSDMYALGATLAHLLAGRMPIADLAKNAAELRERKKTWPSIKKWCPEVSPATSLIIDRLMQFFPSKRYSSYDELIEDINASLSALFDKGGDWQARRRILRRTERRNIWRNWLLILGGCSLVLGGGGLGISLWITPPPKLVPIATIEKAKEEKLRVGMTPEEIEKTYRLGEGLFREKDALGALRELRKLTQDTASPLPTAAWASLQCTLISWASGDFSLIGDPFRLQSILKQIEKTPLKERAFLGLDQMEIAMTHLLSSSGGEAPEGKGRLAVSLIVGDFLRDWRASRCSLSIEKLNKLNNLAQSKSDDGAFAREWLGNLSAYKHDAALWKTLKEMPEKTSLDIEDKLDACRRLIAHPELKQSPSEGFVGALVLYEKKLKVEGEKIRNREERERIDKEIKSAQKAREKQELEARHSREEQKRSHQKAVKKLIEGMEVNWDFTKASLELSKLIESSPELPQKKWKANQEMAQKVAEFFASVCRDIPSIQPLARKVKLKNGDHAFVLGGTEESCRILDNGVTRTIEWSALMPAGFIRLHRESVSMGEKPSKEVLKRHAGAILFLYLVGQKEMAEKAASKFSDSDMEFSENWKEWKEALEEESPM